MTSSDPDQTQALQIAQGAAKCRQLTYVSHASQRMDERCASPRDVECAILTATSIAWRKENDTWRLEGGTDIDGDPLGVAIAISGSRVRVVTVFG